MEKQLCSLAGYSWHTPPASAPRQGCGSSSLGFEAFGVAQRSRGANLPLKKSPSADKWCWVTGVIRLMSSYRQPGSKAKKHHRVYQSPLASKSDPSPAAAIALKGGIRSMSQQDQSPAGLPIKISHQSTGGADLQVTCTKEAEKGLFHLCVPSISPFITTVSFHSHASGAGKVFLFFPSAAPFLATRSLTGSHMSCCPFWWRLSHVLA